MFPHYEDKSNSVQFNAENYNAFKQTAAKNPAPLEQASVERLFTKYTDDVNSFRFMSAGNSTPFIGENPFAYEGRAKAQSGSRLFGNATAQFFLGEFLGGTIQGVGTLARPDQWIARILDSKDAYEETLLEGLGSMIQEKTREAFPIYQTTEAQKGLAWTDATWYASLAPSMASALSIMLPARAAAFVPAKIVRQLAKTSKLNKAISATEKGAEILGKSSKFTKAEHWATIFGAAFSGRVIDSTRESLNKYAEYYDEFVAKGLSHSEAKKEASEAAAKGFRLSHANMIFDIVEWATMLKMGNLANKAYTDSIHRLLYKTGKAGVVAGTEQAGKKMGKGLAAAFLLDALKVSATEGTDEMTMDFLQQEGRYQYDVQHGLAPKTEVRERIANQLTNPKSWDSFLAGAAGGLLFMLPYGRALEKITNKKGIQRRNDYVKAIIANAEGNRKILEEISTALENKDHKKATTLKDQLLLNIASKSYANGTLDYDKMMFENIKTLTPEQLAAEGLNADLGSFVSDIHDNINEISNIFEKEVSNIYRRNENGDIHQYNFAVSMEIARAKANVALLQKRFAEFKETDEYQTAKEQLDSFNNSLSGLSKQYYETNLDYLSTTKQLEDFEKSIKDTIESLSKTISYHNSVVESGNANISKFISRNAASTAEGTIKQLKTQLDKIAKDKAAAENNFKVAMAAFEGVDANGNPIFDKDSKDTIDSRIKDFKESTSNPVLQKYDELEQSLIVAEAVLEHRRSKEGIDMIIEAAEKFEVSTDETQAKEVEKAFEDKTVKELDALYKVYDKRLDIKDSVWKPIYKKAMADAKARSKVDAKKKVDEVITENKTATETKEELIRTVPNDATQGSDVDVSPSVPQVPAQAFEDMPEVDIAVNDISKSKTELKTLSDFAASIERELRASIDGNPDILEAERNAILASHINTAIHFVELMNIMLNKSNRRILFENHPEYMDKTAYELFSIFKDLDNKQPKNLMEEAIVKIADFASALAMDVTYIIDKGQVVLVNSGGYEVDSSIFVSELDTVDKRLYKNVSIELTEYMDALNGEYKSFSELFDGVGSNDIRFEDIRHRLTDELVRRLSSTVDYLSEKPVNLPADYGQIPNINQLWRQTNLLIKDILRHRLTVTGVHNAITKDVVLKYLRDYNQMHRFKEVFFGLEMFTKYLNFRLSMLTDLYSRHIIAHQQLGAEMDSIRSILDLLKLGEINDKTINKQVVDKFLQYNGRETPESAPKTGVKTVLNIYDEDNNVIEIGADEVTNEVIGNNIYNDLKDVLPGTEVVLEQDFNFKHKSSPDEYTWENVPIRVKVKRGEEVSDNTILYLRSLDYKSSKIKYGRKTEKGYEFHGISEVMTKADYELLAQHFDLVTAFYSNYQYATFKNKSQTSIQEHGKKFLAAYDSLSKVAGIKELFLKIINQNLEESETVSKVTPEHMASVFNAVFYGVRLEDVKDLLYNPNHIKGRVESRDKAYQYDFESTKSLRKAIDDGTIRESKIGAVTTPSPISRIESFDDTDIRPSLDMVVKPIQLQGETSKRVVVIYYNEITRTFLDLHTGKPITDSRFDSNKYAQKKLFSGGLSSNMQVLLEAPNGSLIPWNVEANTLGKSYSNDKARAAAANFVANTLFDSSAARTNGDTSTLLHKLDNIVINDSGTPKVTSTGAVKNYRHLERYADNNETRLTILTVVGKEKVFVNIVRNHEKNTVSIDRSPIYKDLEKHRKTKYSQPDDYNIDLNNEEGIKLFKQKLIEISGNMLRQSKMMFDNEQNRFIYKTPTGEVTSDNGSFVDSVTGETYLSPQDYYIRTGAIHSYIGAVTNKDGDIVTNFDLNGRFPMVVTIEHATKDITPAEISTVSELVGPNGLISNSDPMAGLVLDLYKEVRSVIGKIDISFEDKGKAAAGITRQKYVRGSKKGTFKNKYLIKVYSAYKSQMDRGDVYTHAPSYIAHELLHAYINKRYQTDANETAEQRDLRIDNILYHNKALTQYINELKSHWEGLDISAKYAIVARAMKIDETSSKYYVQMFDGFINKIHTDAIAKNELASRAKSGENIGHEAVIQEPITYAYSSPFVALILNGLTASTTDFNSGSKKSFWNLLIEKFLSILNKLVRTGVDGFSLNNKSQLAKLNSLVNTIFDRNLREASKVKASESLNIVEGNEDFTGSKSKAKKDTIDIQEEISIEPSSDINPEDNPFNDEDYEDYELSETFENTHTEDSSYISNMIPNNNPEHDIRDVYNLPIC